MLIAVAFSGYNNHM